MSDDLRDPDPRVRKAAIIAAARTHDVSLLRQLEQLACCDASQDVRRESASAIGRLSREHPQAFAMLVGTPVLICHCATAALRYRDTAPVWRAE